MVSKESSQGSAGLKQGPFHGQYLILLVCGFGTPAAAGSEDPESEHGSWAANNCELLLPLFHQTSNFVHPLLSSEWGGGFRP